MSDFPTNPDLQKEIPDIFTWGSIPNSIEGTPGYQQRVENLLLEKGWDGMEAFKVSYAFHEILNNAIIHGNLGLKKPKQDKASKLPASDFATEIAVATALPENANKYVTVTISLTARHVTISIQDQGVNSPKFWEENTEGMRTGADLKYTSGRGIQTSEAFVTSITYEKKPTGVKVTLFRDLDIPLKIPGTDN